MLNLFRRARQRLLIEALQTGDLDRLSKLGRKIDAATLGAELHNGLNGIELSIHSAQPKALQWVLDLCPAANETDRDGEPYSVLALRQPRQSLGLLTVLLQAGSDPNRVYQQRPLLHWCFELCAPEQLMLHLSRLIEQGARLDETALLLALRLEQQPLVHFLIQSGAPMADTLDEPGLDPALVAYARRCLDDKRIREMMLGR